MLVGRHTYVISRLKWMTWTLQARVDELAVKTAADERLITGEGDQESVL
jgi:hypothetical protein